jgi:SAM-dependent methyltransferase
MPSVRPPSPSSRPSRQPRGKGVQSPLSTAVKRHPQLAPPPEYVLGTGLDETVRLGLQHRLWSAAAHEAWERAQIRPGQTVLDLGCGPGYASLDMAELVGPGGRVIGIDESAIFLKQLQEQAAGRRLANVERVLGDVQELESALTSAGVMAPAGPAGPKPFLDLTYARWVFCFVSDPEKVLRGVADLTRPGGRIVVQDYFNYEAMTLAPRSEIFSRVVAAVGRSWRSRGGDPDIMGRMPAMLAKHGFRVEHLDVRQRIARPGSSLWHWPETFFGSYVGKLVSMGFLTEGDQAEFAKAWRSASQDPSAFMLPPAVFDLIAVRE